MECLDIQFQVIDTGLGISEADQREMFKMFSNPRTDNYQKTSVGLGLSYSKAVITKLNGGIKCQSEKDEGTTITFNIQAKKRRGDMGLTRKEELSH